LKLLDVAEALARELPVMDDELQLEHADVRACAARAGRDRLHVAQAAVISDERALDRRDHLRRRQPADEEDRVALDLGHVHASRQAAHHGVEQLVQDRPAVVDLGLGDELRVAGDVGEHQRAFL